MLFMLSVYHFPVDQFTVWTDSLHLALSSQICHSQLLEYMYLLFVTESLRWSNLLQKFKKDIQVAKMTVSSDSYLGNVGHKQV